MRLVRENVVWAAGLFEGEGCLTRLNQNKKARQYSYWQIKVASTDLDVLERMYDTFLVGGIYEQRWKGRLPHHKRAWQWCVSRQPEIYAVLAAIYPFMCIRRKERIAEALLDMRGRIPWKLNKRRAGILKGIEHLSTWRA